MHLLPARIFYTGILQAGVLQMFVSMYIHLIKPSISKGVCLPADVLYIQTQVCMYSVL
jgi:hypothetical protein